MHQLFHFHQTDKLPQVFRFQGNYEECWWAAGNEFGCGSLDREAK